MWTPGKSITLSIVCTHIIIAILIILSVSLPFVHETALFKNSFLFNTEQFMTSVPFLYGGFLVVLIILIILRRLLLNIKKQDVFIRSNVRLLRIISWLCYLAAIILLAGSFTTIIFFFIGMAAGFIGLIVRVVKNVIDAAVEIKEDADFTI